MKRSKSRRVCVCAVSVLSLLAGFARSNAVADEPQKPVVPPAPTSPDKPEKERGPSQRLDKPAEKEKENDAPRKPDGKQDADKKDADKKDAANKPDAKPDEAKKDGSKKDESKQGDAKKAASVLDLTLPDIDGSKVPLTQFKGQVVMIVNTASKCGLTPQYEALEAIHKEYASKGFVILAFPCNDFMGQEPGSNEQIKAFCSDTYHVTFPIFSKVVVKGDERTEPYKTLVALPAPLGGEPKWNFTKFLIDRKGEVVARFEPKIKPDSDEVKKRIEAELAKKP